MAVFNKYDQDFFSDNPISYCTVKLLVDKAYFNNWIVNGVLLHDGKFMIDNKLFDIGEFVIIDYSPLL